ncbi:MAG: hypothetical protein FWD84_04925, partial [Oscillospiraceae bacterium]|nr:hypothetical protein [Oscillospiraceae bacterium]
MKSLNLDAIKACIREDKSFEVTETENLQTMQGFLYYMGMKARALDEAEKLTFVNMHDPNDTLYDVGSYRINISLDAAAQIETGLGWEAFLDSYVQATIHTGLRSFDDGFDPVWAASLLDTYDVFLTKGELLVEALKMCQYDPDKLLTTDGNEGFYAKKLRDALVTYDPDTGRDYSAMEHPFGRLVLQEAKAALEGAGISVKEENVRLDEQGVLYWKGVRVLTPTSAKKTKQLQTVEGQLGQIFLPDDRGVIVTEFGGSDNYETIPAYRAYLLPRENNAQDTFRERHRVVGYQEQMIGAIRKQLRHDALSNGGYGHVASLGSSIALNKLYGRLYDRRYEIGELDIAARYDDLPVSFAEAIQKTLAGRVRYDAVYEKSTTNATSMAALYGFDELEGVYSPYIQTNQRNLRVLDSSMDGIFDPQATGGAYNQGLVRYLTEDAAVDENGVLIPGTREYCALLNEPEFENCIKYNDWVRVAMAMQQALTAKRVDHHVGTAMVGFGGWNMEDGFVVSKEFAERNMIMDTSGKYRHLRRGDKISDFNGNKGVIGLIVDRHKTAEEQTAVPHLPFPKEAVAFFAENPNVDVVLSPYSPISRANGGAIRDLARETADLQVNGRIVKGAVGFTNFIVTDKTVDEKTSLYDEPSGSIGRRVSSSLAWALDSAGCTAIKDSVYGSNVGAVENLREYLIAVGYDLAADGTIRSTYTPHAGERRHVFRIIPPDPTQNPILWNGERDNERYQDGYSFADTGCYDTIQYKSHNQGKKKLSLAPVESYEGPRAAFMEMVATQGGFLEVPWPLPYYADPSSPSKFLQVVQREDGSTVYHLPIIAPELRNSQEMQSGDIMAHNFTRRYEQLYDLVYDHYLLTDMIARRTQDVDRLDAYLDEHLESAWAPHGGVARLKKLEREVQSEGSVRGRTQFVANRALNAIWANIDPAVKDAYDAAETFRGNIVEWENTLSRIPGKAERAFTAISKTVADQYINGKRDKGKDAYLRNSIMGRKMRNTATLVCIPDPRLDLDTVSMNQKTMKALGLLGAKDQEVLLWRDPILKDGGARYLKVVEDPTVDGVGMNPVIAKPYSGDFDGDQAGLLYLTDKKARAEAREKLHPSAHMLDLGVKEHGRHPLYFGLDQDIQMSIYESRGNPFGRAGDKSLDMEEYLAQIEHCLNAGVLSGKDGFAHLNQFVKQAFQKSYGASPLRFGDWDDLHADFEHIIRSGAKGNASKRDNLYYWMGLSVGADGRVRDTDTLPPDLRKRQMESQAATAMKTDDTGIAGTYTQRLVQVLRNEDIKLAMELTEPIT